MTDPITPPPELVQQWCHDRNRWTDFDDVLALRAAQWGADTELDACCEWFTSKFGAEVKADIADLRAGRRPKPPSSAAQTDSVAKLEDRIEVLEHKLNTLRGDHLRMANAVAKQLLPSDRTKFFVDFMKDAS